MPYVVLGLAVAIGLFFIVRGLRGTSPRNLGRMIAMVVSIVAAGTFVFFAATGRLGPFGWAAALLPLFFRWRQVRRMFKNMRGPTPGQNSDIETRYLRMTLEHDSGVLRGTVLEGRFQGRNLEEMSLDELLDLLRECRIHDVQSATVLESYLDRVHGAGWREGTDAPSPPGGSMTRDQAYEILGLSPGASEGEIREAHRRLLQANHPDRGGSTFIAAQINQAKDVLLSGA